MMLRWRQVEVSGGFLLLAALLYYMDGDNLLPWALLACVLHELGHLGMIYLMGGRVTLLRVTCVGAEMRLSARRPLSTGGEVLAALAGPAANLLAAIGAARLGQVLGEDAFFFAGLNLALCAFNLLPVAGLDGGRVFLRALGLFCPEEVAEGLLRIVSTGLCAGLAVCGAILLGVGRCNITLCLTGGWLLLSQTAGRWREQRRRKN